MEDKKVDFEECRKIHKDLGENKWDGTNFPMWGSSSSTTFECAACGCHRNFHRKIDAAVIHEEAYRSCFKNHNDKPGAPIKDGCQSFISSSGDFCAGCKCHKSFHFRL
ncbi:hypothetical protein ACJIZ3_020610 [Penstemon smallii]|uniref:ZF-HD dimerization-type domain-containing protein n=1 Tax=Penstemon smallii TaxID=265156 RepID=A0ABD3SJL3_9LAMI